MILIALLKMICRKNLEEKDILFLSSYSEMLVDSTYIVTLVIILHLILPFTH